MDEDFAAFLREKKIDPLRWSAGESQADQQFHILSFRALGKIPYEQRYLFYFNRWRKLYPLSEASKPSGT